jgi:hypothetical protein
MQKTLATWLDMGVFPAASAQLQTTIPAYVKPMPAPPQQQQHFYSMGQQAAPMMMMHPQQQLMLPHQLMMAGAKRPREMLEGHPYGPGYVGHAAPGRAPPGMMSGVPMGHPAGDYGYGYEYAGSDGYGGPTQATGAPWMPPMPMPGVGGPSMQHGGGFMRGQPVPLPVGVRMHPGSMLPPGVRVVAPQAPMGGASYGGRPTGGFLPPEQGHFPEYQHLEQHFGGFEQQQQFYEHPEQFQPDGQFESAAATHPSASGGLARLLGRLKKQPGADAAAAAGTAPVGLDEYGTPGPGLLVNQVEALREGDLVHPATTDVSLTTIAQHDAAAVRLLIDLQVRACGQLRTGALGSCRCVRVVSLGRGAEVRA